MSHERGKKKAKAGARPGTSSAGPAGASSARVMVFRIRLFLSLAAVASFALAHAGPSNWLWGMNLLRFYPEAVSISWTLAALLAIWLVGDERGGSGSEDGSGGRTRALAWSLGAATIAAVLFNIFRTESLLLGDGMEIVRRLHQGNVPAPRSALYNVIEPVFFRMFSAGNQRAEGLAAGILSVVAGTVATGLATFFLFRIGRRDRSGALAAAALLFLAGSLQLFFGYIEVYPLQAAASLVFFAAAFDRLTGGGAFALLVATLAFLFGVASHPFGTTLAPGWLYLVATRRSETGVRLDRKRLTTGLLAGLSLFFVLTLIFALWPAGRAVGSPFRFVAPQEQLRGLWAALKTMGDARPWADRYRQLSLVHLADVWNTLWLVGAAGLATALAIVSLPEGRKALREPVVVLAVLCLLPAASFRLIFRTPLGALRDWDLFSGFGFGVATVAAALALTTSARRAARSIAIGGLFFLVPWIGIQISNSRAARRHFEAIEASPRPEPAVEAYFHCVMGDRFANLRRFDLAARAYERALATYPRYEFAWRLGTIQVVDKKYPEAVKALERALELSPGDMTTQVVLAEALMGQGDLARAAGLLEGVLARKETDGLAHLRYGQIELARGRRSEAAEHFALADRNLGRDQSAARQELEQVRTAAGLTSEGATN